MPAGGVGRFVRRKEMSKRTGLGRGLGAFFGNDYEEECVKAIEDSIFQGDMKDQIQQRKAIG
jgi:hypothetical protein